MTTPTSPFNALKLLEQHVEHTLFLLAIDKMDMSFMPTIYDALIKLLIPECEARFIPIEYFDLIALFVAEDEQCISKRIQVHILLNDDN